MRRHHKEETPPPVGWVEIARVTATGASTVNIPAGYSSIGLWIVGGGGGRNNNVTNAGGNATFYGGGGGGGAFSSNHGYGAGGAGYQGIVGKTS